ncbi:ankyrin repeat domain-containing protein 13C-like isoform X2 [Petromyzon marinus]|uniref:Ankyrin repeat domain-containing protein 13C-like isoform X2 n=1 Tax=Petromyzon marinus TaxID=7757 RepID=A0AAJ7U1Y2_PETMA|nr:ankyrin repeat domain-containing protein 13C-like isoform X2 [Petromyzon marinus]
MGQLKGPGSMTGETLHLSGELRVPAGAALPCKDAVFPPPTPASPAIGGAAAIVAADDDDAGGGGNAAVVVASPRRSGGPSPWRSGGLPSSAGLHPLHHACFHGDARRALAVLAANPAALTQRDPHGNTALHVAVMLGNRDCTRVLLAHNAPVKSRNAQGWSPLAEAVSLGHRQTIASLVRKYKLQSRESAEIRRPRLLKAMQELGDFYLEVHWDFQSWVPLVSRMLPSDTCKVYKHGSNIRMDTTLIDFSDMKWQRGDLSILFGGETTSSQAFTVLDNSSRVYQRIQYKDAEVDTEEEVDALMSRDIVSITMSTKNISFHRAHSGWLFSKGKTERVGDFVGELFSISGLCLVSRKRREHLTESDVQRNKALLDSLRQGGAPPHPPALPSKRDSLAPPPSCTVQWEDYIAAEPGRPPVLARRPICKETKKHFRATVAMCPDFPVNLHLLLNVLEAVAPFKHFSKLRQFVEMRLPPGFPVKLDVPVFPTVSATVTFREFRAQDSFPPELFLVPHGYTEDPAHFPDL